MKRGAFWVWGIMMVVGVAALWNARAIRAAVSRMGEGWSRLHPDVQARALRVFNAASAAGLHVGIFEGYRSAEAQEAAMRSGASWVSDPDGSYHRWGLAVDFVFLDRLGRWTWDPDELGPRADQSRSPSWQKLGAIIEGAGFQWGGRFRNFDGPHAELPLYTIAALKSAHGSPESVAWA